MQRNLYTNKDICCIIVYNDENYKQLTHPKFGEELINNGAIKMLFKL